MGKFQNFMLQTALEEANNPHKNFWRGKMPPSPGEIYQACPALAVFVNVQVLICGSQEEVSQAVMLQIQVRICSVQLRLEHPTMLSEMGFARGRTPDCREAMLCYSASEDKIPL